eukprot:CAMPEP_0195513176 /NCGR_PEP_ID=MMETSP0794_2-20130614/4889_1 /TAXON_ID=515487 /ORGANISM="Stephanopyxis turris, Strain CCMP 815" /LENGTH=51 /DNA_ID=CAMNT_0040641115 /DNA_START=61 /DNA_END=213 /DNA_ORIENTATION=-
MTNLNLFDIIFAKKLEGDDRFPALTFYIPGGFGTYGILIPDIMFWAQLGVI